MRVKSWRKFCYEYTKENEALKTQKLLDKADFRGKVCL